MVLVCAHLQNLYSWQCRSSVDEAMWQLLWWRHRVVLRRIFMRWYESVHLCFSFAFPTTRLLAYWNVTTSYALKNAFVALFLPISSHAFQLAPKLAARLFVTDVWARGFSCQVRITVLRSRYVDSIVCPKVRLGWLGLAIFVCFRRCVRASIVSIIPFALCDYSPSPLTFVLYICVFFLVPVMFLSQRWH